MNFEDCDYSVQQIPSRTREEKIKSVDRDAIEKERLAKRREHFERNVIVDNIVKPEATAPYHIDDVDRFDRDYTKDQKQSKEMENTKTWARATAYKKQQMQYEESIKIRRETEELEETKKMTLNATRDFNQESVLYDPVTNASPPQHTIKGSALKNLDDDKEMRREARARRIYHNSNSVEYDPITGEKRKFW